ncbi:thioredoxin domain-containing protein 16 isoform X4 [Brachyhypopomus gauderio]|uniref:thioredoxin domain-containing protein 16 isoform X4 n=1 Tax=Brachyhypopomus gauderio TaxID=698409 RepID=UPI0040411889
MLCLYVVALILTLNSQQCENANTSKLVEHTAASFMNNMMSGKTYFIYFVKQVNSAVKTFIEQLEMSADVLEDYGILIGKVNCSEEAVEKYCTEEEVMKKIYLFRGPDILRTFDIDTVFDVNAIVSHVLFAVLFDEVRYVHTPAELQRAERSAKGTRDIVMGHIRVLGLPEHRALMEAAFVYGSKYQFILTSGAPLLRHMEIADPTAVEACLWFLHCSRVSQASEPCPHTLMRKPLTTINIHTFLQLMEAPLLPETLHLDRVTAENLALRLRGEAGLVLVHRDNPSVKTPLAFNAAYRLPQEQGVRYFTLRNVEEVVTLFREQLLPKEEEEEDEEDGGEDGWSGVDVLDDEVAESVYRDRGSPLDTDVLLELTAPTFSAAVTQNRLMVVLFYVKWDAVSMAFMQSYVQVAHALEGVSGVKLASVNCGEWTDVCADQNISSFPSVLLYQAGEAAQPYRGMLGAESLHTFLLLCRPAPAASHVSHVLTFSRPSCPVHVCRREAPSPLELSSAADVLSFLDGELYGRHEALARVRVLGLFAPADPAVAVFVEAAKSLRGQMLLGLFVNEEADAWAEELAVTLPALLVSRGPGVRREAHALLPSTSHDLVNRIRKAAMDTFPELTVDNLPWYLELGKPLLLLFIGGGESPQMAQPLEEMREVQSAGRVDHVLPCWIHLGRTPAGRSVLKAYLGFVPPLPVLVLSRLGRGGEVFHFPSERPLLSENIVQWLQRIENNQEQSAGAIPDTPWDPPVPFYDFLAVMDEEAPGYASQRNPKVKPEGKRERPAGEAMQEETASPAGGGLGAALNPQTTPQHTEL